MAHFFFPGSGPHMSINFAAAENSPISQLIIKSGANAHFGVWGGGWKGEQLRIQVYRGSRVLVDNPPAKNSYPAQNIYIYSIPGLANADEIYGVLPDGVSRFTGALKIVVHSNKATDVIAEWAQHYSAGETFSRPHLYPSAVPYLALSDRSQGTMTRLNDGNIGGALNAIHGLAVHTTAGTDARTPYQMARYGCVGTWNGQSSTPSAHFAIAGGGTVVQFIPTDWVAFAQGSPGDNNWISVEIDNNGVSPMRIDQLTAVKALFQWVCRQYGVWPTVATGCLFPTSKNFDEITTIVCQAAGSDLTYNRFESAMSRGVSCHWWLNPGHHACPGKGIISQLASISKPALVS